MVATGVQYDAAGNMINDGTQAYSFDEANRLKTAGNYFYTYSGLENKRVIAYNANGSTPSATINLYGPDGKGLGYYRFSSTNGWTTTTALGFQNFLYLGNKALTYIEDRIGSAGNYFPYGNGYNVTGAEVPAFGTYVQDESGLLYADQRYYAAAFGRFMTADRSNANIDYGNPTSWNRYAYTNGDPVNGMDPSGLFLVDCMWSGCFGDGGGSPGGGGPVIDGVQQTIYNPFPLGGNSLEACPNNVCNGFTTSGSFFQFVAGASGASGYINFSDITHGVNEWNGTFYSNSQFQSQVVAPAIDNQRWALAAAISSQNGQDINTVYNDLTYVETQGGNADFAPDPNLDLSFLDPDNSRSGAFPSVHQHGDGLVHLDTGNPYAYIPIGLLVHFIVDVGLGNINPSVPMQP